MTDKNQIVNFRTDRIVCLDASSTEIDRGENLYLFAEVIDTIASSDRCWVRPLAIARSHPESFKLELFHDLRDTAQLILPTKLFREALDTEVIPLISELFHPDMESNRSPNAQQILYQFIADIYGARN